MPMADSRVRVVTWNVHGFVGSDGRWDPQRVAEVLHGICPDLMALQEVDARSCPESNRHPLDAQAAGLDATVIAGPTLDVPERDYGNAVLSRLPVADTRRYDISRPGAEPRSLRFRKASRALFRYWPRPHLHLDREGLPR